MDKLRYSEAFYSVQGEGKFVGVPSVFLRTFGCNFRCMNFGVDTKKDRWEQHAEGNRYNAEVKGLLDAGVHKQEIEFEQLPIVHTGCDTYASIYPEFKHFNKQATIDEVVEHLLSLTPNGKWVQDNGQDVPSISTGSANAVGATKPVTITNMKTPMTLLIFNINSIFLQIISLVLLLQIPPQ